MYTVLPQAASGCDMIEKNVLNTSHGESLPSTDALSDIEKHAYEKISIIGEDYAMMIVMTG